MTTYLKKEAIEKEQRKRNLTDDIRELVHINSNLCNDEYTYFTDIEKIEKVNAPWFFITKDGHRYRVIVDDYDY